MARILVIDDEPQIRRFLRIGLAAQRYDVMEAGSGAEGLSSAVLGKPDLVVLDLGLPDMDGQEVLQRLRESFDGPVVILSVRHQERDKVQALDAGANDYVVKPFSIQELLARIRVLLRSRSSEADGVTGFDDGHLQVCFDDHRVLLDGEPVRLSRKEFSLLRMLVTARGRIVTQRQILSALWGDSHLDDTHYLRVFIGKLRNKLKDVPGAPRYLETEPGVGYRFIGKEPGDA